MKRRLRRFGRAVAKRWNYWRWNRWPYVKVRFREWRKQKWRRARRGLEALGAGKLSLSPADWVRRHPRSAISLAIVGAFLLGAGGGVAIGRTMGVEALRAERRAILTRAMESGQIPEALAGRAFRGNRRAGPAGDGSMDRRVERRRSADDFTGDRTDRAIAILAQELDLEPAQRDSLETLFLSRRRNQQESLDALQDLIRGILRPEQLEDLEDLGSAGSDVPRLLRRLADPSGG